MRDIVVIIFLAFVFVWTNLVIFLIVSSFCLVTWPLDPTSNGVRDVFQPTFLGLILGLCICLIFSYLLLESFFKAPCQFKYINFLGFSI